MSNISPVQLRRWFVKFYIYGACCIFSGWTTGRSGFDPRQGQRIFPLTSVSRPALGPTQPPVQWVPGVLSPGLKRSRGVTLTTHPHLVPRSRMSRSYTSSPPSAFMACSGTALVLAVYSVLNVINKYILRCLRFIRSILRASTSLTFV
jgi:hypothetical protein